MSLDIWLTQDVDLGGPSVETMTLKDMNITHNLGPMWKLDAQASQVESEGEDTG